MSEQEEIASLRTRVDELEEENAMLRKCVAEIGEAAKAVVVLTKDAARSEPASRIREPSRGSSFDPDASEPRGF